MSIEKYKDPERHVLHRHHHHHWTAFVLISLGILVLLGTFGFAFKDKLEFVDPLLNFVRFEPGDETEEEESIIVIPKPNDCLVGGCSGQVCSDTEVITTCEFRQEYACYRDAECKRQASGECGWTETAELQACLEEADKAAEFGIFEMGGTGIRGTAMIGPTCPVVSLPPDPACADKPYEGKFRILGASGVLVSEIFSDEQGKFSVELPAGNYTIVPVIEGMFPLGEAQELIVEESIYTDLELNLDSGIR
jgi:eight-cysteine-cluster-containing protein